MFFSGPDLAAKELGVVLNPVTVFTLEIMDISYKVDKFEWTYFGFGQDKILKHLHWLFSPAKIRTKSKSQL